MELQSELNVVIIDRDSIVQNKTLKRVYLNFIYSQRVINILVTIE